MEISISHIIIVALLAGLAYFAGKFLYKKDSQIEDRRRAAVDLAASLKSMGFQQLPEFFADYAVGDYSGMAHRLGQIAKTLASGEKAILGELDVVFMKLLEIKLNSQDGRFVVSQKLAEVEKMLTAPASTTERS